MARRFGGCADFPPHPASIEVDHTQKLLDRTGLSADSPKVRPAHLVVVFEFTTGFGAVRIPFHAPAQEDETLHRLTNCTSASAALAVTETTPTFNPVSQGACITHEVDAVYQIPLRQRHNLLKLRQLLF